MSRISRMFRPISAATDHFHAIKFYGGWLTVLLGLHGALFCAVLLWILVGVFFGHALHFTTAFLSGFLIYWVIKWTRPSLVQWDRTLRQDCWQYAKDVVNHRRRYARI